MVLAGLALRREGGINFQTGGGFQRRALWSVILLTLPQFLSWFAAQGISMPGQGGNITSAWVSSVEASYNSFVSNDNSLCDSRTGLATLGIELAYNAQTDHQPKAQRGSERASVVGSGKDRIG